MKKETLKILESITAEDFEEMKEAIITGIEKFKCHHCDRFSIATLYYKESKELNLCYQDLGKKLKELCKKRIPFKVNFFSEFKDK